MADRAQGLTFYLGTHEAHWLWMHPVSLFVSYRRIRRRGEGTTLRPALAPWALDSGAFSEIQEFGRWTVPAHVYAEAVDRYAAEIGQLDWASPMDWMVEPHMVERTGLSVREHQDRTIASVIELRQLVGSTPVIPVLQGWTLDEYLDHVALYAEAGFDLAAEPIVGLGSVCRRQNSDEIAQITRELASGGLDLHGFGVKMGGFGRYARNLASADSLAWSWNARRHPPMPGCTHKNCSNCIRWALRWRDSLLARGEQLALV